MRPRSFSWSGFRSAEDRNSPSLEPSLAQEDDETRASVYHYLRLAAQLLATDEEEVASPEHNDAA